MLSGYALLSALVIADAIRAIRLRSDRRTALALSRTQTSVPSSRTLRIFHLFWCPKLCTRASRFFLAASCHRERTLSARIGQPMHSPGSPVALRRTYRRQVW
jgi:hypothetical protein